MKNKILTLVCLSVFANNIVFGATLTVNQTGNNAVWGLNNTVGTYQNATQTAVAGDVIVFDYVTLGSNVTITIGAAMKNVSVPANVTVNGLIGLPPASRYTKIRSSVAPDFGMGVITLSLSNTTLKGLDLSSSARSGILMSGTGNTVDSCFLYSNTENGVLVTGANNNITNCTIGTDGVTPLVPANLGNGFNGVYSLNGNSTTVSNCTVMFNGRTSAAPDKISGIRMEGATDCVISNNYIGTDVFKNNGGNGFDGITLYVGAHTASITNNVVCYNGFTNALPAPNDGEGIAVRNSNTATIQGNFVGVHPDGTVGGNDAHGVTIEGSSNSMIGGTTLVLGNWIAGQRNTNSAKGRGLWIVNRAPNPSNNNEVYNNKFGDALGTNPLLGNSGAAIAITGTANNNIIGAVGQGNTIVRNGTGILVDGASARLNTLRYNSFLCNTGKGIDLTNTGNNSYGGVGAAKIVTTNKSETRVNFVSGTAPNNAVVDIYARDICPANPLPCESDSSQGASYVATVNANGTGFWEYDITLLANTSAPTPITKANVIITATETGAAPGATNTSEFSVCDITCTAPQNLTINGNDVCSGGNATLVANANGINPSSSYQYYWYLNSVSPANEIVPRNSINDSDIVTSTGGTYIVVASDIVDSATCSNTSAAFVFTVHPLPIVSVNNETECENGPASTFTATSATAVSYIWSGNGSGTQPTTSGITVGNYIVEVTDNSGCKNSATGVRSHNPAPTYNLTDTFFCVGHSVPVAANPHNNATVTWSPTPDFNLVNDQTITVNKVITYTVIYTEAPGGNGCADTTTVSISEKPLPVVDVSDGRFCNGSSLTFDAGNPGMTYAWEPNKENTQTITASLQGWYFIVVKDPTTGCSSLQDSAFADLNPDVNPILELGIDDSICVNKSETAELTAVLTDGAYNGEVLWSNGSTGDLNASYSQPGTVWVMYTDSFGCSGADTLQIIDYCETPIFKLPPAYIPGGTNPTFTPTGSTDPSDILSGHMEIYDRWGLIKFATDDLIPEWDGNYNGRLVSAGVYYWIWTYKDVTETDYKLNGFVQVLSKK